MNKKGFTLFEMLVVLTILSLATSLTVSSFSFLAASWGFQQQVRDLQAMLSKARYKAVYENRPIRISLENRRIALQTKPTENWEDELTMPIKKGLQVSMNAKPVFQPHGLAAPLCSIVIEDRIRRATITITMAGRIRTRRE